jgi:hypothetical protein
VCIINTIKRPASWTKRWDNNTVDAHKLHNIQLDGVDHNLLFDPAAAPIALAQGAHEDNAQQHNAQQHNLWIFEHKQPVLGVTN